MNTDERTLEGFTNGEAKQLWHSEQTEAWEVVGTPFTLVKQDLTWLVMMGKYRLSENPVTLAEAKEFVQNITWNGIMAVVAVLQEEYKEVKNAKAKQKQLK